MTDAGKIPQARAAKEAVDRAANVFDVASSWLFGEPMATLLAIFNQEVPPGRGSWESAAADASWLHLDEELPAWLDPVLTGTNEPTAGLSATHVGLLRRALAVERAAADHLNFRVRADGSYRERAEISDGEFDEMLRKRIHELTRSLGLVSPERTRYSSYDHTLVLGGGYRSPLLRARYAAHLRADGIDLGEVSFLGSPRFLLVPEDPETPPERQFTDEYAPGATDEFDLMVAAAQAAMSARSDAITFRCGCVSADVLCPKWSFADEDAARRTPPQFTHERQVDLLGDDGRFGMVLSASTGRPPFRPDTADTFRLWARLHDPQPGLRLLVVTTQVFVPFQTFDGLRRLYLPYGADLEFVGLGAEWGDRPETAEYLLQETLSAIRSARRLLVAAAEVLSDR